MRRCSADPANHPQMATLAGLPDIVRGYEDVKAGNVATYVAELRRQAAAIGIDPQLGELAAAA